MRAGAQDSVSDSALSPSPRVALARIFARPAVNWARGKDAKGKSACDASHAPVDRASVLERPETFFPLAQQLEDSVSKLVLSVAEGSVPKPTEGGLAAQARRPVGLHTISAFHGSSRDASRLSAVPNTAQAGRTADSA